MLDKLLERFNLKYDDLNPEERETLNSWIAAIEKSKVTPTRVRDYISSMKSAVERDLGKTDHNTKQDIFLKARLRNYLLIEAFLTTPERAEEQLEQVVAGFAAKFDKK